MRKLAKGDDHKQVVSFRNLYIDDCNKRLVERGLNCFLIVRNILVEYIPANVENGIKGIEENIKEGINIA